MSTFYFRIRADGVEVLAGQVDRRVIKENWIILSVSDVYVHEEYLPDKVYNDVAVLKASKHSVKIKKPQVFCTSHKLETEI